MMKIEKSDTVALKVTKDAKNDQFVDCEIHSGAEVSGRSNKFKGVKVYGFYNRHKKTALTAIMLLMAGLVTLFADISTIVGFFKTSTLGTEYNYAPQTISNSPGATLVQGDVVHNKYQESYYGNAPELYHSVSSTGADITLYLLAYQQPTASNEPHSIVFQIPEGCAVPRQIEGTGNLLNRAGFPIGWAFTSKCSLGIGGRVYENGLFKIDFPKRSSHGVYELSSVYVRNPVFQTP